MSKTLDFGRLTQVTSPTLNQFKCTSAFDKSKNDLLTVGELIIKVPWKAWHWSLLL